MGCPSADSVSTTSRACKQEEMLRHAQTNQIPDEKLSLRKIATPVVLAMVGNCKFNPIHDRSWLVANFFGLPEGLDAIEMRRQSSTATNRNPMDGSR